MPKPFKTFPSLKIQSWLSKLFMFDLIWANSDIAK